MDDRARRDRRHQGGLAGGCPTPAAIPPRPPHFRPTDVRCADEGSRRGARRVLESERVKADASVYEGKRVIRRALALVPGLERVDPNVVTVAILIPAVLAGVSLWQGWWILAAIGAAGRMVVATLDGYVAERFERRTPLGAYLNRIVTEVADAIVLLGLLGQADALWVALAIASAWIVNIAGVLGPVAGGSIQWTGPAGQADRLAIVLGASLVAIVWPIDWTILCGLLVTLSVITAARRVSRSVRELRA